MHMCGQRVEKISDLRNKPNLALFMVSRSVEETDRFMSLFDQILQQERERERTKRHQMRCPLHRYQHSIQVQDEALGEMSLSQRRLLRKVLLGLVEGGCHSKKHLGERKI